MRISFDLDGTLVRYGGDVPTEKRLPLLLRIFIIDEPLRLGTRQMMRELVKAGHELWVYTSSSRSPLRVRLWLRLHGIPIRRVINGLEHAKHFGRGSYPEKKPDAFQIDLHIDDAPGVKKDADWYGFRVHLVDEMGEGWWQDVLDAVQQTEAEIGAPGYEI